MTVEDKLKEIQEELDKTPRNKGTEHHVGKLKAKIARLKEEKQKRSSKGKKGLGYSVKKTGDATVVLAGFPSVGKSTLLNKLTNADSKIAEYEFTTLDVIPGILEYKGARIQILDVPGIVSGAASGKGRGKEVLSVVRLSDLIIIMIDASKENKLDRIKQELHDVGLRLNKNPPNMEIKKKIRGGITITYSVKLTKISEKTIKAILDEYSIHNADVIVREDLTEDRLIDALSRNRCYVPMFVIVNKIDLGNFDVSKLNEDYVKISASKGLNIDKVKELVFEKLGFIRVYTKPHGRNVNYNEPLIMKKGVTVLDMCGKIHRDLVSNLEFAKIWGTNVKFDGQRKSSDYILHDGDVIQLNFKN